MTSYRYCTVDGNKIFYREAGPKTGPAVLLLHGFPTSSHMFRNLIPLLEDKYHVVAPDLPGFGFSDGPAASNFATHLSNWPKPSTASPRQSVSSATRSTYSITARQWDFVLPWRTQNGSPPSFHRTAMRTKRDSARAGTRSRNIGANRPRRIARHSAAFSHRKPPSRSTCMGSGTRHW